MSISLYLSSQSVLRYVIHFYPVISLSVVHYILSSSPISFLCFLCIYLLFFLSVFMSITRYISFIFLCIFLIPFIFVLASKRNNCTHSEINTISWVIWNTSVTVESKGRFFSGFVFCEGLMKNLAGMTLAKVWAEFVIAQNSKWPPSARLIIVF